MSRPIQGPSAEKLKYYCAPGCVEIYACKDPDRPGGIRLIEKEDAVTLKVWNNMSFLSKQEVADLIYALSCAAEKQWGAGWRTKVEMWWERGHE